MDGREPASVRLGAQAFRKQVSKRMTVIFEAEVYTALKVEAARKGQPAKDIVAAGGPPAAQRELRRPAWRGPGLPHPYWRSPAFSTAGSVDRHPQGRSALGIHVLVVVASHAPSAFDQVTDDERLVTGADVSSSATSGSPTGPSVPPGNDSACSVTELTATLGYDAMLACALNAFEVEPDEGAERLP